MPLMKRCGWREKGPTPSPPPPKAIPTDRPRRRCATIPKECVITVVCLPAHDQADEIVGVMLGQLLELRGYCAVPVSHNVLASEMLAEVENRQADIVCVSALPPAAVAHVALPLQAPARPLHRRASNCRPVDHERRAGQSPPPNRLLRRRRPVHDTERSNRSNYGDGSADCDQKDADEAGTGGVGAYAPFIASTPPMISDSSVVIWLWRARLYCMVSALTILSALSVALFIATMRATCSLVVASRKAWNSAVLTVSGSSSSSSSLGSGRSRRRSFIGRASFGAASCRRGLRLLPAPAGRWRRSHARQRQQRHHVRLLLAGADEVHVGDVDRVDFAVDELAR